jgi:DNA-binding IclR family transcriptional regulator
MEMNTRVAVATERLKNLFLEIPGTQLSAADAARLAGLDETTCQPILEALEQARFLARRPDGLFVRRTSDSPAG